MYGMDINLEKLAPHLETTTLSEPQREIVLKYSLTIAQKSNTCLDNTVLILRACIALLQSNTSEFYTVISSSQELLDIIKTHQPFYVIRAVMRVLNKERFVFHMKSLIEKHGLKTHKKDLNSVLLVRYFSTILPDEMEESFELLHTLPSWLINKALEPLQYFPSALNGPFILKKLQDAQSTDILYTMMLAPI